MRVNLMKRDGQKIASQRLKNSFFDGLGRKKVDRVEAGDLCAVIGLEGFEYWDTIADIEASRSITIHCY